MHSTLSSARGRGRGRGGGWQGGRWNSRGAGRSPFRPIPKPSSDGPLEALLQSLHPLQTPANGLAKGDKLTIEDCKYISSYNWHGGKGGTILVPGSPPTWLPHRTPVKLSEDRGTYYRDVNAAHYPPYPLEPAIRALFVMQPEFDCESVDIVGCGNTLGCLLSACRLEKRDFSFGVEKIGTTVFLVRQTAPEEVIEGVYGYGHSFPEAYTTWAEDVRGSASHQRLIKYQFGGLKCLIRSETDGYLPVNVPLNDPPDYTSPDDGASLALEGAIGSLDVHSKLAKTPSKLEVKRAGRMVPQSAIVDIKTRSIRREVDVEEFLPRLWVNQTPNFIVARHTSGTFNDIQVHDLRDSIKSWEGKNQDILRRLHTLLTKLVEITNAKDRSRVQVRHDGTGTVEIRAPTKTWTVLPTDLKARWTGEVVTQREDEEAALDGSDEENNMEDYLNF